MENMMDGDCSTNERDKEYIQNFQKGDTSSKVQAQAG
jgi:hypothetical protein